MEPIISPWWFYIASVCSNLNIICMLGLLIITALVFTVFLTSFDVEDIKEYKSAAKIISIAGSIFVLGLVFIPSRQDVYFMMAAQVTTPDNIAATQDNIVGFVKQISNAIRQNQNNK